MIEFADPEPAKVAYIRQSELSTWGQCAKKHHLLHTLPAQQIGKAAVALAGNGGHEAVRYALATQRAGVELSERDVIHFGRNWFLDRLADYELADQKIIMRESKHETTEAIADNLALCLRVWWAAWGEERRITNPMADPFGLEWEFQLRVWGLRHTAIKGTVDLIMEDGWIGDHKFCSANRRPTQESADRAWQASQYCLAYREEFGKLPAGFRYYYLIKPPLPDPAKEPPKPRKKTPAENERIIIIDGAEYVVGEVETHRTDKQLKAYLDDVARPTVGQMIESKFFPRCDPGQWWCSEDYCEVWDECNKEAN